MAYSNFTIAQLKKKFHVKIEQKTALFGEVAPRQVSEELTRNFAESVQLAGAIGSEKARSELVIMPILLELRRQTNRQISLFSGIEFNVDAENGLNGICDFLISRSTEQFEIEAPVITLVEAKRDDLRVGLPQCIAEMIAARIFNEREGNNIREIFGTVTTGSSWQFLRYRDDKIEIETPEHSIENLEKVFGILWSMVS